MNRRYAVAMIVALWLPRSLASQSVASGQRVRISLVGDSVLTGVVDSVAQDRLWFHSSQRQIAPSLGLVQRIEVSQGRKPAWKKGLGLGALAGVAVGSALWLAFINGDEYLESDLKGAFAAALIGGGAVGGALAGAGLSVVLARERWTIASPDRLAVGPSRWKVGLRFAPNRPAR